MKNYDEVRDRLETVFRETFDDDNLKIFDAMTAADVDEWDSMTHIALVLTVEKEFGIRLTAAEGGNLENVGQMIAILRSRATR